MPKDLISVGQRGVAIIDASTPKHIKGFCTYDIQSCLGFYLVGNNFEKHALMHIDRQTAAQSIARFVSENFREINDHRMFFNPAIDHNPQDLEVANEILKKIDAIPNFKRDPRKSKRAENGSVLIDLSNRTSAKFRFNHNSRELQQYHGYDRDFEEYRTKIHYINAMFGSDKFVDDEFPLDLQYQGRSYTKLPEISHSKLPPDLESLKGKDRDEIKSWLLLPETIVKYPHLRPITSSHAFMAPILANDIIHYWQLREKCALTEYKIPLSENVPDQEKNLSELTSAIGEEAELAKHRSTNWGDLYFTAKLKSGSLVKNVRDSIGLDRLRINKPSEQQIEDLLERVPEIVIEGDAADATKSLITFAKRAENREIIKNIIESAPGPEIRDGKAFTLVTASLSPSK